VSSWYRPIIVLVPGGNGPHLQCVCLPLRCLQEISTACRTPKTPERHFMTACMNKEKGNVTDGYYAALATLRNRRVDIVPLR